MYILNMFVNQSNQGQATSNKISASNQRLLSPNNHRNLRTIQVPQETVSFKQRDKVFSRKRRRSNVDRVKLKMSRDNIQDLQINDQASDSTVRAYQNVNPHLLRNTPETINQTQVMNIQAAAPVAQVLPPAPFYVEMPMQEAAMMEQCIPPPPRADSFLDAGDISINSKKRFVDTTLTAYKLLDNAFQTGNTGQQQRFGIGLPQIVEQMMQSRSNSTIKKRKVKRRLRDRHVSAVTIEDKTQSSQSTERRSRQLNTALTDKKAAVPSHGVGSIQIMPLTQGSKKKQARFKRRLSTGVTRQTPESKPTRLALRLSENSPVLANQERMHRGSDVMLAAGFQHPGRLLSPHHTDTAALDHLKPPDIKKRRRSLSNAVGLEQTHKNPQRARTAIKRDESTSNSNSREQRSKSSSLYRIDSDFQNKICRIVERAQQQHYERELNMRKAQMQQLQQPMFASNQMVFKNLTINTTNAISAMDPTTAFTPFYRPQQQQDQSSGHGRNTSMSPSGIQSGLSKNNSVSRSRSNSNSNSGHRIKTNFLKRVESESQQVQRQREFKPELYERGARRVLKSQKDSEGEHTMTADPLSFFSRPSLGSKTSNYDRSGTLTATNMNKPKFTKILKAQTIKPSQQPTKKYVRPFLQRAMSLNQPPQKAQQPSEIASPTLFIRKKMVEFGTQTEADQKNQKQKIIKKAKHSKNNSQPRVKEAVNREPATVKADASVFVKESGQDPKVDSIPKHEVSAPVEVNQQQIKQTEESIYFEEQEHSKLEQQQSATKQFSVDKVDKDQRYMDEVLEIKEEEQQSTPIIQSKDIIQEVQLAKAKVDLDPALNEIDFQHLDLEYEAPARSLEAGSNELLGVPGINVVAEHTMQSEESPDLQSGTPLNVPDKNQVIHYERNFTAQQKRESDHLMVPRVEMPKLSPSALNEFNQKEDLLMRPCNHAEEQKSFTEIKSSPPLVQKNDLIKLESSIAGDTSYVSSQQEEGFGKFGNRFLREMKNLDHRTLHTRTFEPPELDITFLENWFQPEQDNQQAPKFDRDGELRIISGVAQQNIESLTNYFSKQVKDQNERMAYSQNMTSLITDDVKKKLIKVQTQYLEERNFQNQRISDKFSTGSWTVDETETNYVEHLQSPIINLYDVDLSKIQCNETVADQRKLELNVDIYRSQRSFKSGYRENSHSMTPGTPFDDEQENDYLTSVLLTEEDIEELDENYIRSLVTVADDDREEEIKRQNDQIMATYENNFLFLELRLLQVMQKMVFIQINNSNFLDQNFYESSRKKVQEIDPKSKPLTTVGFVSLLALLKIKGIYDQFDRDRLRHEIDLFEELVEWNPDGTITDFDQDIDYLVEESFNIVSEKVFRNDFQTPVTTQQLLLSKEKFLTASLIQQILADEPVSERDEFVPRKMLENNKVIKFACDPYAKHVRIAPVIYNRRRQMLRSCMNMFINNEVLMTLRFDSNAKVVLTKSPLDDRNCRKVLEREKPPVQFMTTRAYHYSVSKMNRKSIYAALFKQVLNSIYYNTYNFDMDYELRYRIEQILRIEREQLDEKVAKIQRKREMKRSLTDQDIALHDFTKKYRQQMFNMNLATSHHSSIQSFGDTMKHGSIKQTDQKSRPSEEQVEKEQKEAAEDIKMQLVGMFMKNQMSKIKKSVTDKSSEQGKVEKLIDKLEFRRQNANDFYDDNVCDFALFRQIVKQNKLYDLATALDKRIEMLIDKTEIDKVLQERRKNQDSLEASSSEQDQENVYDAIDACSMSDGDDIGEEVLPGAVLASMDLFGWGTRLVQADNHPYLMEVYCIRQRKTLNTAHKKVGICLHSGENSPAENSQSSDTPRSSTSDEQKAKSLTASKQTENPQSKTFRFNKYEDFLESSDQEEPWRKESPLYGLLKKDDFDTDDSMQGINFQDMINTEPEQHKCAMPEEEEQEEEKSFVYPYLKKESAKTMSQSIKPLSFWSSLKSNVNKKKQQKVNLKILEESNQYTSPLEHYQNLNLNKDGQQAVQNWMDKSKSRKGSFLKVTGSVDSKKLLDELLRKQELDKQKRLFNVVDHEKDDCHKKEENFYERLKSKVKVEGLVNMTTRLALQDNREQLENWKKQLKKIEEQRKAIEKQIAVADDIHREIRAREREQNDLSDGGLMTELSYATEMGQIKELFDKGQMLQKKINFVQDNCGDLLTQEIAKHQQGNAIVNTVMKNMKKNVSSGMNDKSGSGNMKKQSSSRHVSFREEEVREPKVVRLNEDSDTYRMNEKIDSDSTLTRGNHGQIQFAKFEADYNPSKRYGINNDGQSESSQVSLKIKKRPKNKSVMRTGILKRKTSTSIERDAAVVPPNKSME